MISAQKHISYTAQLANSITVYPEQIDKLPKKKLELLQVQQHGLKPLIPPFYFAQYPDKNNTLIPQDFAFIPATSFAPSPKESAPLKESA